MLWIVFGWSLYLLQLICGWLLLQRVYDDWVKSCLIWFYLHQLLCLHLVIDAELLTTVITVVIRHLLLLFFFPCVVKFVRPAAAFSCSTETLPSVLTHQRLVFQDYNCSSTALPKKMTTMIIFSGSGATSIHTILGVHTISILALCTSTSTLPIICKCSLLSPIQINNIL